MAVRGAPLDPNQPVGGLTETGDECPASKGFFGRIKDKLGG